MPFSPKLVRISRRLLIAVAVVATLFAAIYAFENWRGDHAWEACYAKHAAAGEPLDYLPKPSTIPAASNFMKAATLDAYLYGKPEQKMIPFLDKTAQPRSASFEWRSGKYFDFEKYSAAQKTERAKLKLPELPPADSTAAWVLAAQEPIEPVLNELRTAVAERPLSELVRPVPISRDEPFNAPIPSFQIARLLSVSLSAQACALIAQNQPDNAFADTMAALRFSRGFTSAPDPMLVESMIGVVLSNIAIQPLWEGCQKHAWNDRQLQELQRELALIKPLKGLERSMRIERAGAVLTILNAPVQKLTEAMPNDGTRWLWRGLRWGPRGWLKQNATITILAHQSILDACNAAGTPAFFTKMNELKTADPLFGHSSWSPHTIIVQMIVPAFVKVTTNTCERDVGVSLALTACALERYRLARGGYPEHLTELVTTYIEKIPLDIIDGQPLRYRRTDDGKFVLYSVGLDGKDDQGEPVDPKKVDGDGDWVWPQAANSKHD